MKQSKPTMEAYYLLSALALERFWPREVCWRRKKSEANLITDGLLLFFCVVFCSFFPATCKNAVELRWDEVFVLFYVRS